MNKYKELLEVKVDSYKLIDFNYEMLSRYKQFISDKSYFDFIIESKNGGFFFNQALQIYNYSDLRDFSNIEYVNAIFRDEFGEIYIDLLSFGQDTFGFQFCFNIKSKEVVLFNPESGERDVLSTSFTEWIKILLEDIEHLTGSSLLMAWLQKNKLDFEQRLCPKKPFIIGGEYNLANLYAGTFPEYIKAYANFAKQIYNLPDGTSVKLNIVNPPKS